MATERAPTWQRVVYALAWPVSAVLVLVDLLLLREVIVDILTWAAVRRGRSGADLAFSWTAEFVDKGLLLILAIAGVAAAIALEFYLRRGLARGSFLPRLLIVLGTEAVVAGLALVLRALI